MQLKSEEIDEQELQDTRENPTNLGGGQETLMEVGWSRSGEKSEFNFGLQLRSSLDFQQNLKTRDMNLTAEAIPL